MSPEGERAVQLLRFANYASVAKALGVSRSAVARWGKGEQVTPWQLQRVEELLQAPPEPLIAEVRAIRTVVDALAENQAAAIVSLGEVLRRLTPLADDPAGDQESQRRSDRPDR